MFNPKLKEKALKEIRGFCSLRAAKRKNNIWRRRSNKMKKYNLYISIVLLLLFIFFFINSTNNIATAGTLNNTEVTNLVPEIEFTHIPSYGSDTATFLSGKVHNAVIQNYGIAVYILVQGGGWWTKPSFANPITSINSDSIFCCNIVTGGCDKYATEICAFLIPSGILPPQAAGSECLSDSLYMRTFKCAYRAGKPIPFSGYNWWIKTCYGGPGPNKFSDKSENVWTDALGRLHLKITLRNSIWYCAEVVSVNTFGYGRYVFQIDTIVGNLDKNVVLGLFTWDDSCAFTHRELDIEFSRWGNQADTLNAQYVIQPFGTPNHIYRWRMPDNIDSSTHTFLWKQDTAQFLSAKGFQVNPPYINIIKQWNTYTNIPPTGNEKVRMNLWLFNGVVPSNGQEVEVIIRKFQFISSSVGIIKELNNTMPKGFELQQNYPNPFNPSTKIKFEIPSVRGIGNYGVKISIYDITGRELETLVNQSFNAGTYEFEFSAENYSSGAYIYRMTVESSNEKLFEDSKIMTILK
jgi:hypothetical protein